MLYPSIFKNDLFDDIFDEFKRPVSTGFSAFSAQSAVMKTDIKETEKEYQLDVEIPGVKKENLTVELKDGSLEIKAVYTVENEDENEGKYIRRERFYGSCSRSFYVGEDIKQEDIKAKFENGMLKLIVPKVDALSKVDEKHFITIE